MTEADKVRQLNIEQLNAIDLLITGQTDSQVGEAVGVARQTVTEWRNNNSVFAAELNRKRTELWGASQDTLRRLVANAVEVIAADLAGEDLRLRQQAAVHVLKAVGLYGGDLEPGGPTDAESVELVWRKAATLKSLEHSLVF